MKLPGTYAVYALIMAAFGETIGGIHLGLLLVNAASIVLVYMLGGKLFSAQAGVAACAAFALLSVSPGVLGTQAHATHFIVLAALGGLWLLLRFEDTGLFASGVLFGAAFVVIQHGVFFGMFAAAYLAVRRQWRKLPLFLAGCSAPFVITCLVLWWAGVFGPFWFWTFTYARSYVSESSLREGAEALATNFGPILRQNAALWALAAAGLVLMVRARRYFVPVLLLFSAVAVCPGFFFRAHYFVVMLPAAALLAGACVRDRLSAAIFASALLVSLFTQRDVLFRFSPAEVSRELYGIEPFPEAIPVADYIRAHTRPEDRIAVLASEPEIYFYARRHSATSLLYIEPLVEPQPYAQRMQNDMIAELERNQPAYLVRFPIIETLSLGAEEPAKIFQWWTERGAPHYRLAGIADILEDGSSVYRWDAAAQTYQPRSLYHLAVYRRQ
jgi:hypothetical protein